MHGKRGGGLAVVLWLSVWAHGIAQGPAVRAPAPTRSMVATFASVAPVIDGKDDDAIWKTARPVPEFRQSNPIEDGEPAFRTVAFVAYDAHNLYVFMRALDPHPDSIAAVLSRRDGSTASDFLGVLVDSYHDRRTGYELDVNPLGVKSDWSIQNDGDEDITWDGVWDVATRRDSLGWTAEFRIPLSQLRYKAAVSDTFGIYLWRHVNRLSETSSWPRKYVTRPGLPSQFAELTGLTNLAPPSRAVMVPYVVAKDRAAPGDVASNGGTVTVGGDLRYAIASNVTVNATVNPDFGQVEADPAQLNLTTVETFQTERRPFFVQDANAFNLSLNCAQANCPHESLFYSRRIGRAPQLGSMYGDAASPSATRILGAAKLTGRLGGLVFGGFGAATQQVDGPADQAIEPAARYEALRASQDFRQGESGIGFMATGVQRDLDASSAPFLHSGAYAGGIDFRHRIAGQYVIKGSAHWSVVDGAAPAIAALQRQAIHNYQRPDGTMVLDTTRTSLSGDDEQLAFDKLGGTLQFEAFYSRRSPGFDVNDIGYLQIADMQSAYAWLGLMYMKPTRLYRSLTWNANAWLTASTAGLVTDRAVNTNAHMTLLNLWKVGAALTFNGIGTTFCDRCARGGPALRRDASSSTWFDVTGDMRGRLAPELTLTTSRADGGRSTSYSVMPMLNINASTRLSGTLMAMVTVNHDNTQWVTNVTDGLGQTHYTFARLDQKTIDPSIRINYTASSTLSLQGYAEPFASWGTFDDARELGAPRAVDYASRFVAYGGPGVPAGLNSKQLNANVVVRWEYRPGSQLFVVWSQGRQDFVTAPGTRGSFGNLHDVFSLPSDNTFLVKLSYWFSH